MSTTEVSTLIDGLPAAFKATRPKASRALVILSFLAIYLVWGSTYLAIRYAVETIPPLYTAGMRHLVAGAILAVWCIAKGLRPTAAQIRASIVIGFFFFLLGHGSLHWAETRVPSGLASLLIATEPIFVFVFSSAANRRWKMNAPLAGGVLLGLAGVAVLMGHSAFASGTGMLVGSLAVLGGGLAWSVGIIYSRRSHLSGSPLLLSALSLLAGAAMLLITGTIAGEWRGFAFSQVSTRSWEALAYLIVFGSVVAFTAYNWLMEHYSPTLVATHTYINPIVAVLLGWLLAGEALTPGLLASMVLVILAVILVDRGMARIGEAAH